MLKKVSIIIIIFILIGIIAYYAYTLKSVRLFILGKRIDKLTFENEKLLGAKINFTIIRSGWIKFPLKLQMDEIWKKQIKKRGMNYFIIGAPASIFNQYSDRFNPRSKLYQAWFGCYTVIDDMDNVKYGFENGEPNWQKLAQLAVADQNAWLKSYGLSNPHTKIDKMLTEPAIFNIDGCEGHISFWQGSSQSDLNDKGSANENMNILLGTPKKKVWEKIAKAYHPIKLHGFFLTWRKPPYKATFCCYGCGVQYKTTEGNEIETFSKIKDEMLEMAQGIKIQPLKDNN
jgi:hypothetical protein